MSGVVLDASVALNTQTRGRSRQRLHIMGRSNLMSWDKHRKPPADACPEGYCFHWIPPGGAADYSGNEYVSVDEALTARSDWTEFPTGGCGCRFGACTRSHVSDDARDWYEPNEPALQKDGLPWFYFIPCSESLVPERREEYLRESALLWGPARDNTKGGTSS